MFIVSVHQEFEFSIADKLLIALELRFIVFLYELSEAGHVLLFFDSILVVLILLNGPRQL